MALTRPPKKTVSWVKTISYHVQLGYVFSHVVIRFHFSKVLVFSDADVFVSKSFQVPLEYVGNVIVILLQREYQNQKCGQPFMFLEV